MSKAIEKDEAINRARVAFEKANGAKFKPLELGHDCFGGRFYLFDDGDVTDAYVIIDNVAPAVS